MHPEQSRAYLKRYRDANRDRINSQARERHAANPARRREQYRAQRLANLEHYRALDRLSYQRHKDRRLEKNRAWREANPDYAARHREQNRMMYRAAASRRRAAIRKVHCGEFTGEQLTARMAYFGNKCWQCGGPFEEVDHVKPIYHGGPHILSNLRPSCLKCNRSKGRQWPYPKDGV